jgi:YopX protein
MLSQLVRPSWRRRPSSIGKEDSDWEFVQFTGLHDNNGKEIYEGDVVEWEATDGGEHFMRRGAVVFKGGAFTIEGSRLSSRHDEIIGNIYENPQLLNSDARELSLLTVVVNQIESGD